MSVYRKSLIFGLLAVLGYAIWISPDFGQIAAGVAVFLFGMLSLENGFRQFTGGILEKILRHSTDTIPKSLGFGIVSTALMQSSSLVTVIAISFLSAGLLPLIAGIGIIFGSNLGTTTGAWLFATVGLRVSLSAYALPLLIFGVVLNFQPSRAFKGVGAILAGVGFLFLGIDYMKIGFESFQSAIDLADYAVDGLSGLLIFTALGLLATVVMQSSHATLALTLAGMAAAQITYENALALAIGANLGTTITAVIGGLGANIAGRRLAGAHVLFNMVTATLALVFFQPLLLAVDGLSTMVGIADDDYLLKLAVFHTLFNGIGVAIMLPFIARMAALLEKWMPDRVQDRASQPMYLNAAAMDSGATACAAVRREVWHLFDQSFGILANGLHLRREQIRDSLYLEEMLDADHEIIQVDMEDLYQQRAKSLYGAILDFISAHTVQAQSTASGDELYRLQRAAGEMIEAIKHIKHLRKNLTRYIVSNNSTIRHEYNELRQRVALVLRETDRLSRGQDGDVTTALLTLDEIAVSAVVDWQNMNARVTRLLRESKINATMATSLLNDSGYASEAVDAMLSSTRALITSSDPEAARTAAALSVRDDEQAGLVV